LNYPAEREELSIVNRQSSIVDPAQAGWVAPVPTGENMSVLVNSVSGVELNDGDQIAAFSSSGQLLGVGDVLNGRCGLAVWGDDPSTEAVDGAVKDEPFMLKLWDAVPPVRDECDLVPPVRDDNCLFYDKDGIVVLDVYSRSAIPGEYYLSQNYPNPFNAVTNIRFGLPEAGYVNVSVYDVSGRIVETLINMELIAGHHVAVWNAEEVAPGMYLIYLWMEDVNFTRKAVILK